MDASKDSEGGKTANHLETDNVNDEKEWEQARGVLKDFDERLHDLRKYGFSFLTALLTAGSILSEIVPGAEKPGTITPEKVKLGVFVVTLMLIVALHLFDKNYRVFQRAAYTRALVLERKLNLELSETISTRYRSGNIERNVLYVYILFICGVAALGGFILYPNWGLIGWLAGFAVVALIFILGQNMLRLEYRNRELEEDWTVSPLECTKDESIRITLNNMGSKPIVFKEGTSIWELKRVDEPAVRPKHYVFNEGTSVWEMPSVDEPAVYTEYARTDREVQVDDNYTWVKKLSEFPHGGLKKGVYQLQPRLWTTPLPISIIVS